MLNAKQARAKTIDAINSRKVSFDQAIDTLNHEVKLSIENGLFSASVAFEHWMEDKTCKKVKKYLKKQGYKWIIVEEDYISCSW